MYKIDILLKQNQKVFHTQDLALLWGIINKNTLYTTIKRYVNKGVLIPIHKGFYSTIPVQNIDPIRVGVGFLHTYAYLSTETILLKSGIIFQDMKIITFISDKSTSFSIGKNDYKSRKMSDCYLNNDCGLERKDGIFYASPERAVADMLYFNPKQYFDNKKEIDWKKVKKIQKEVGY